MLDLGKRCLIDRAGVAESEEESLRGKSESHDGSRASSHGSIQVVVVEPE